MFRLQNLDFVGTIVYIVDEAAESKFVSLLLPRFLVK